MVGRDCSNRRTRSIPRVGDARRSQSADQTFRPNRSHDPFGDGVGFRRPGRVAHAGDTQAELANSLGISRTVIRKALDILEADGQIFRVKGRGTVVAPPKFRYEAVAAARQWLTHDMEKSAILWRLIHISVVRVGHQLSRVLRLTDDQELWEIVFASAVGGTQVSLSQLYLQSDASAQLRTLFARRELPQLVAGEADVLHQLSERYAVSFRNSDLTVESTLANQFEAEVLRLRKGTPMFLLSELDTGAHGQPLAFSRTVVRSDHFRFSVAIRLGPRHPEFTDPLVPHEIRDR